MAGGSPAGASRESRVNVPPPPSGISGGSVTGFVGVPDGHTSPASFSDWFKPDRQVFGAFGNQLLGAIPRAPMYVKGTENAIFDMSAENIARLQGQMALAGLLGKSTKFRIGRVDGTSDPTFAAFKKILTVANTTGNTWEAALNDLIANPVRSLDDQGGAVEDHTPTTQTHVNKSVQDYTAVDARAAAEQAWEQSNGRAPKGKEAANLRAALNAYAQANPSVTTQTVHNDGYGNTNTSTSTTGGVSADGAGQIALEQSQAAPDYAEFQAAGVYFPALERMLGATADVRGR